MKSRLAMIGFVVLAIIATTPAYANKKKLFVFIPPVIGGGIEEPFVRTQDSGDDIDEEPESTDSQGEYPISAREAAMIAKSTFPGSKVLRVRLLPSGVYAVTLRGKGRLTRVKVDAQTGEIF